MNKTSEQKQTKYLAGVSWGWILILTGLMTGHGQRHAQTTEKTSTNRTNKANKINKILSWC